MEEHVSVSSLVIVVLVAFLTPIILHRLKINVIPVVVAEIIMGLIIGESGFQLVHPDVWLDTLSMLGFIFLMFLSGLEIDFSVFAKGKKKEEGAPNSFLIATITFVSILILSYGLSLIFVYTGFIQNALLMTLIISTISLGIVVPTLKESQIEKSNIGQTILLIAVIADLVTMILLAVFVSIYGAEQGNMWLLLLLFGAGIILYFLGKYFKHRSFIETMSKGTIQIGTRAVFTLIIILVGVSESVGAENILGAFLAGVLVSLLSPNPDMVHKLDSFGYGFLIPIFFVMIGVELNIWSLFSSPKVMLLIPLLLIALYISKLIPILILKKWYDWRTMLSSGFLLTSTLSLVIAASTIGDRMGVISEQVSGALILVAVISCIISPIVFKKLFPKQGIQDVKQSIAFIGANPMTLPVIRELDIEMYKTYIYHMKQDKIESRIADSQFSIYEVDSYDSEELHKKNVFDVDILVVSTSDDEINSEIAIFGKENEVERVIARIESPELDQKVRDNDIDVFSVLLSTKTLLRALIESPSVINILTTQENALYEISMNNPTYHGVKLRNSPFAGDVIMVRIFRNNESIVPHGDTELQMNDRLIVTGSKEYVNDLRLEFEFQFSRSFS